MNCWSFHQVFVGVAKCFSWDGWMDCEEIGKDAGAVYRSEKLGGVFSIFVRGGVSVACFARSNLR